MSLRGLATIDLDATMERLLSMGAKEHQPVAPRGEPGFVGNVLGVPDNPHYLDVLASTKPA